MLFCLVPNVHFTRSDQQRLLMEQGTTQVKIHNLPWREQDYAQQSKFREVISSAFKCISTYDVIV